jgi:hypothetical protein
MTVIKKKIKDIFIEADNGINDGGVIRIETFEPITSKTLSSTWYPKLFDSTKFTSRGDAVLQFFNLLKDKPFNDLYSLRGYVAEKIVQDMLKEKGYALQTFSLGDDLVRYKPDKNPLYKYFRGLPDILYTSKDGERKLLEIKSKSLSKLEYVLDSPPETEIMQGKMLAILEDLDEVTMTYVLFDEELERKMMMVVDVVKPYDNEKAYETFMKLNPVMKYNVNYKIHTKTYKVDRKVILDQMKHAYKYADGFRQTMTVKIKDLSKEVFSQLFKFCDELEEEQKSIRRKS